VDSNVYRLTYKDKELILIATAHVSKESAALVKRVIEEEQPDSVCVELDKGRYEAIKNPKEWQSTDVIKIIKSKKTVFMLANLALSSYQKRLATKLNIKVGQEMIQGIESAELCGAELVLADRNIQTTLMRIWRKLKFFEKLKMMFSLFMSSGEDTDITDADLENMLKEDILESLLKDLKSEFPTIGEVLLSERDQYLAHKIKNAKGSKIVAVLGGAHVPGIKEEIYKEQDLESITFVPPASKVMKVIGWSIPAAIIGMIIYSFVLSFQTGVDQLTTWILWNGIFASLFTALSFGHPISIITAFVVAPISSLNPLVACGVITGLVEAMLRKPTVEDVSNVPQDFTSVKGFLKNRFLRVLLIVVMANLGSTIGTFVAGLDIVKNIF
jgi:pheromone shutdown-related protein TraB